ncbi:hypothetical protein EA472_07960 [Natrarchaeobius oligotrophus]|uniref:Uncharacterized protein n=1 Tax=Natrarchaeobius chitinivorans TaxID=1679083 RepID=A0A3N6PJQ2_NATCH|nr:hypothetical protein EA472_07960 [Natrarchaeobius chitinivorans]
MESGDLRRRALTSRSALRDGTRSGQSSSEPECRYPFPRRRPLWRVQNRRAETVDAPVVEVVFERAGGHATDEEILADRSVAGVPRFTRATDA